jgi:hypothetical protein
MSMLFPDTFARLRSSPVALARESEVGTLKEFCMNLVRRFPRELLAVTIIAIVPFASQAIPVVRFGTGASASEISPLLDQFRLDFGGTDNGVGGSFSSGFRTINWDGVPNTFASPNALPADYFNTTSPRGAVFGTPGSGFGVSATAGSGTPTRFGNIDPSYSTTFQAFSNERLFTPVLSTVTDVRFFIPGQSTTATVQGFGVVFCDVDRVGSTSIQFLDVDGNELFMAFAPVSPNGGLSFLGITGLEGAAVARIRTGDSVLAAGNQEGAMNDLVVMDDLLFGEPMLVPEPSTWAMLGAALLAWRLFPRARRT